MAGNFIPMVYATLKQEGIDVSDLTIEQAIQKYNALRGKGKTSDNDGKFASKGEVDYAKEYADKVKEQVAKDKGVHKKESTQADDENKIANGNLPSILTEKAQKLIKEYAGKGKLQIDYYDNWDEKEKFFANRKIGICRSKSGLNETTRVGFIHYSNKGVHIVPGRENHEKNK